MKQRFIQHFPDQSLQIAEQTLRDIRDNEVLIAVAAFGINRPDLLQKAGLYPAPADASPILGLEVAGTIVACGKSVQQWREGDRVCALVNGGGYSDYCFAPATQCLPWPENYSAAEAACLPESFITVWHNLLQRGKLQAGETLLIQAGSSGIGTTAIQLATLAGARVFTTAGSAEKCARCVALGAENAFDYHQENLTEQLLDATQKHGVDVTLDILGGAALAQHIKLAAVDGRIVNIAVLNGSKAEINLAAVMMKRLTITGSTLRAQSAAQKAAIMSDIRQRAWHWIESGAFRPVIDSIFDFQQVETAHQHMQSRAHFGKIAITIEKNS
ncbi:MAG TPA: NAD(P)H-quinone oxidoreductase [Pseudomonadales bacterium]|nr:NAD(P)H-quinone oxidoreductase [Pseudomonadales bacterium]